MIDRYSLPEMAHVWSQENKIAKWLQVEIAACEAWAEAGAIPQEALSSIRQARCDLDRMAEIEAETDHDVIAFLRAVGETVGEASRFIHMGLTSSDVVDTAMALQTVEAIDLLAAEIDRVIRVLERQAVRYRDTAMIGRTHGVHAEPITFGFKLAIWVDEMRRNATRLAQAREEMAVGKLSGAVGTHANIPPEVEEAACARLGLVAAPASNQILQRDRHARFISTLAIIASSLDKFATEMRHLQRTEVLEAEEPFGEKQQGSSAMPHKRNPHKMERISGLARVLRGHAVTAMENVALWHERDISHSSAERIIFPESCMLLHFMLRQFGRLMDKLIVYPDRMKENLELTQGLIFSQRVLLALVEKGMDRQRAYKLVQDHAMAAWRGEAGFRDALKADKEIAEWLTALEIDELFEYNYHLRHIDATFRRLGLAGEGPEEYNR